MRIIQKRIRQPKNYLVGIAENANFYISVDSLQNRLDKLNRIGLNIVVGEQVLPSIIGPISKFNSEGRFDRQYHLPKETVHRAAEIRDWHGNYHTVYIPYKRYPRIFIQPPSVELLIRNGLNNQPILISPLLRNNDASQDANKHIINLILEIFGECEILQENLLPAFNVPTTKLNWHVLPQGRFPWEQIRNDVDGVINTVNQQKRGIVQRRIQHITSFTPDFAAVGKAGFNGYLVFGFSNKNLFVLESIFTGNATYVLGQNWQQISQLSKGDILDQNLHQQRITHSPTWDEQINSLLN